MKRLLQLLSVLLCAAPCFAQEAQSPANPSAPAASGAPASSSKAPANTKQRALPSFLIIGTVFNEKALSFPGVQVRIRRGEEKKFRWETYTDSRGEFAVRVVPGYAYEVVTHAPKYKDQKQTVDSKVDVQQRLSIKLEPAEQSKAGVKP